LAGSAVISIVDDDAWARSGLSDLILSLGYEVRAFESAEQFIQSGRIQETACLITDLNMPGLSGLDLQSHLRERGHRTPVIFVTAYPSDRHRERALADGAAGFLSKPFDEKSLVACLTRAIQ
jgi:FixJ family two-component response regulator